MAKHILMLSVGDPEKNTKIFLKDFTGKAVQWKLSIKEAFKPAVVYQKTDDVYVLFDDIAKQPIMDFPKLLLDYLL